MENILVECFFDFLVDFSSFYGFVFPVIYPLILFLLHFIEFKFRCPR